MLLNIKKFIETHHDEDCLIELRVGKLASGKWFGKICDEADQTVLDANGERYLYVEHDDLDEVMMTLNDWTVPG